MKKQSLHWIILIFVILIMTACQTNQEETLTSEDAVSQTESISLDEAYPSQDEAYSQTDEAYPVQSYADAQVNEAYPVSTDDLQLLIRSWSLHTYSENGVVKDAESKTIEFLEDSYKITTDEGIITGTWKAHVETPYPVLVLDPDTQDAIVYDIVTLNETTLKLRIAQDQIQIEEEYMPVE